VDQLEGRRLIDAKVAADRKKCRAWYSRNAASQREKKLAAYHERVAVMTPPELAALARLRRARSKKWKAANRGAVNANTAARYAAKTKSTPSWSNTFFVGEAYDLAARRTDATGIEWQVDHVVPLRSSLVCGLHADTNVRVIPGIENQRKNNKAWPDMPA